MSLCHLQRHRMDALSWSGVSKLLRQHHQHPHHRQHHHHRVRLLLVLPFLLAITVDSAPVIGSLHNDAFTSALITPDDSLITPGGLSTTLNTLNIPSTSMTQSNSASPLALATAPTPTLLATAPMEFNAYRNFTRDGGSGYMEDDVHSGHSLAAELPPFSVGAILIYVTVLLLLVGCCQYMRFAKRARKKAHQMLTFGAVTHDPADGHANPRRDEHTPTQSTGRGNRGDGDVNAGNRVTTTTTTTTMPAMAFVGCHTYPPAAGLPSPMAISHPPPVYSKDIPKDHVSLLTDNRVHWYCQPYPPLQRLQSHQGIPSPTGLPILVQPHQPRIASPPPAFMAVPNPSIQVQNAVATLPDPLTVPGAPLSPPVENSESARAMQQPQHRSHNRL